MAEGFCCVAVEPSPKSQAHDVGFWVEVSVNCTVRGASPEVGEAVKLAVGAVGAAVTVIVLVAGALVPPAFDAVMETV